MQKVNYKLELTTSEDKKLFEGEGYLEDGLLSFNEDDFSMTIDMKRDVFTREGKEIQIRYDFDLERRTYCNLNMKEMDQSMSLVVETLEIKKEKNRYYVAFEIVENDKIIIDIEFEEINDELH